MAVIPILFQLYGATQLTKVSREAGNSWKQTILMGLGVGAVLASMWSMPYRN